MKTYSVHLSSPVATSFRCVKAANSLSIDVKKKSEHHLSVCADIEKDYNIGLIVGASGSGKSTLAKQIYGEECTRETINNDLPVIDQFPDTYSYDECAEMLCGVGLTSVPCWIRPVYTLSNGQRARAEVALRLARGGDIVIDEWTSVVDRTVAKVMSHCVQKYARKSGERVVLLSCHRDVVEWLNPDWIIDCDTQQYTDRRLLCRSFKRAERISFDVYESDKRPWKFFSRYHYLSEILARGKGFYFGLFHNENQIGFLAFNNYTPHKDKLKKMILHFNRLVIHPDYCGLGIGVHFLNSCSKIVHDRGYDVWGKFSSAPVYNALKKDKAWVHRRTMLHHKTTRTDNRPSFRTNVVAYSFQYKG